MEATIEEALAAVKGGDADAYEDVVNFYHRRLRAAVASRCPPALDPDEIAQIAFIDAFGKIDRYELGTEFYVWLWVFARNTLLVQIRKMKRTGSRAMTYVDKVLLEQAEQDLASETIVDDNHIQALRRCLSELPEQALSVLRMRYAENAPLKVVAKFLGKSVSAVKFHVFAMRRALRNCVEKKLTPAEL